MNKVSENRTYSLNIPQMLWDGLSENWLMKELGDIHWKMISEGLKTESDKLVDSNGNRLYASFVRIKWESNSCLGEFSENEEVEINSYLSKYGNKMFFSNGQVTGLNKKMKTELMSVFSSRNSGNNQKLIKGTPLSVEHKNISDHNKLPKVAKDFFKVKSCFFQPEKEESNDIKEIILNDSLFDIYADVKPLFQKKYQIDSYDDINGVGLLYFASYPKISDKCELSFFQEKYIGEIENYNWAKDSSTIARDIHYYGNANANEELVYSLENFSYLDNNTIKLSSSLIREKDGVLIAKIFTIKKLSEPLEIASAWIRGEKEGETKPFLETNTPNINTTKSPDNSPILNQNFKGNSDLSEEQLCETIINFFSKILENNEIAIHTDLRRFGVESIVYTELSEHLNIEYGFQSNPSTFYGLFTVKEIASFLLSTYNTVPNLKKDNEVVKDKENSVGSDDIAIIGLSLKMPGANTKEEFWENLVNGNSCITTTPKDRWDWPEDIDIHGIHKGINYGGYIKDVDKFDASFFGISPREVKMIDPQQRILLELTWELIESSGYKPSVLKKSKTGVFIGASGSDYETLLHKNPKLQEFSATGTAMALLSNRISYFYDFDGPSLTIDTACSSSLVAINNAIASIKQNECEQAIVGGIHLMCEPTKSIAYKESNMLSIDGKCYTFDERANGYVRGEGAVMFLLKPLKKAIADNDNVLALIKSTAVNHGGYSGGVTVPNPNKQKQLIEEAYTKANIGIQDVSYIEAHGTGTSLGDPIEVLGLTKAFQALQDEKNENLTPWCWIGSIKTNIGHLEAASGIAGLLKVTMAMKYNYLPASQNFKNINSKIEIENKPFRILENGTEWLPNNDQNTLIAGVSSFGIGGANAHVVLESYKEDEVENTSGIEGPYLFILSARREEILKDYVKKILSYINQNSSVTPYQLSYTLQATKEEMEHRLAFVYNTIEDLKAYLVNFIEGSYLQNTYVGSIKKSKLNQLDHNKIIVDSLNLRDIAEQWCQGSTIKWEELYPIKPKTLEIPTYPFDHKKGYWVSYTKQQDLDEKYPQITTQKVQEEVKIKTSNISEELSIPSQILKKTEKEVSLVQDFNKETLSKPINIPLMPPGQIKMEEIEQVVDQKIQFTLSDTLEEALKENHTINNLSYIKLFDQGNGTYSLEINADRNNTLSSELVVELIHSLEYVKQLPELKVLLLRGNGNTFLQGGREAYNESVVQGLYRSIAYFPYPIIAEMQGDAIGSGFLLGALCDFMVCSQEAKYSYTDYDKGPLPTLEEELLFRERFGEVFARDFLYQSGVSTGYELEERGWSIPIAPSEEVRVCTEKLAQSLCGKPQISLHLLKEHLGRNILRLTDGLSVVESLKIKDTTTSASSKVFSRSKYITVETDKDQILVIRIHTGEKKYRLKTLVSGLGDILGQVKKERCHKAIVLTSDDEGFLRVSDVSGSVREILEFQRLLIESPIPVISAIRKNAKDIGWLIAQSCDVCIYQTEGDYSASSLLGIPELSRRAGYIFEDRLGSYVCQEVLLSNKIYRGIELQKQVGGALLVSKDPFSSAMELATLWSFLSIEAIRQWKKDRVVATLEEIDQLPLWRETEEHVKTSLPQEPTKIQLKSEVIRATVYQEGIVEVRMEDREAKNMFSDAFIDGITEIFEHIAESSAYKVVILTGYDNYFISGGTKEMLLDIQEGKIKFTDAKIYHLALKCKIPVIGAMQGHGIGAGWSMGMFCDFPLFSEGGHYVSPYMNYGFTPGAGSTLIFPERIGYDLARDTLLTGVEYSGQELKEKGLPLPVLPRKEVFSAALTLAKQLVGNSRDSLIALKDQLTDKLRIRLEETYSLELAMHEKTFVGRSDTLERIENNFNTTKEDTMDQAIQAEGSIPSGFHNISQDTDVLSMILASLKKLLAQELHMEEGEIDEDTPFIDLGLDSIIGVTWIRKINEKYKISINATKIYSYPNLKQFSSYVKVEAEKEGILPVQEVLEKQTNHVNNPIELQSINASLLTLEKPISEYNLSTQKPTVPVEDQSKSIAVIGMAGRFPKAKDVEAFWQNIAQGKNCINEISKERWDIDKYYQEGDTAPEKTYSKWMGALEEYDLFDPLFFNISPSEAEHMDPQQRLFLQTCWHAIEYAGYNAESLANSKCGVFVGCGQGDYHLLSKNLRTSAYGFTGGDNSILAARISYFLNLQGPCLTIDTACSSSLVAIANACDSLILGQSDLMLAGGVYVGVGSDMHVKTSQMGMLSPEGTCYTFDQRANGFVPGEGVGVVMLKRLEDAERDKDNILGVIQGWGTNQDGKTNGITAPNTEAQSKLQQEVYDKYNIDPSSIQLVEAHGTGTKLGDPIEVEALVESFKKYTPEKEYCALGSVKSNIGHCLMAAGVAGMIKLLMSLKYKKLPPTINFEKLNEHIGLENSPFYINTKLKDWEIEGTQKRQAAISSFGFSGTNAHMVIGEYSSSLDRNIKDSDGVLNNDCVFLLSAKTEEQLKQKAIDLLTYIDKERQSLDMVQVSYTLQVGRMEMEQRLGFVANTTDQLIKKLKTYIEGKKHVQDVFLGEAKRNKATISLFSNDTDLQETVDKWIQQKKLSNLISLWVQGHDLDWNKLYGEDKPLRTNLPVYPFAKERYWFNEEVSDFSSPKVSETIIHPLLHQNTSMIHQQRYSSIFTGRESFLNYDQQTGVKFITELASLEMARAAIEHSLQTESSIELNNIVWSDPMIADPNTEFTISLYEKDNVYIDFEICSNAGNEEIIHCQGVARINNSSVSSQKDIEWLKGQMMQIKKSITHSEIIDIYQKEYQSLIQLSLSDHTLSNQKGFVIYPAIIEHILKGVDFFENKHKRLIPLNLGSIQVVSPCTQNMHIWTRFSKNHQSGDENFNLDIDLYDDQGSVCTQIRELSLGSDNQTRIEAFTNVNENITNKELFQPQETTQTLFYREYWQDQPDINIEAGSDDQQTIIFTDKDFREKLVIETENLLSKAIMVEQADSFRQVTPKLYHCHPTNQGDIGKILNQVTDEESKPVRIIYTWAKDQGETSVHMLFDLFKTIKSSISSVTHVTLVGYYNPSEVNTCWDYSWIGFERSLKLLLPNIQVSLLYTDIPSCTSKQLLDASQRNGVLWYKDKKRHILSIQSCKTDKTDKESVLKQNGSYLITGGCGSLGLQFAYYLAKNYNANLILVGRRQITSDIEEQIKSLKETGTGEVYYTSVDVSDRKGILALKSDLPFNLSGIIHAAGVESSEPFNNRSTEDINTVLHPKTIGSILLDEIFNEPSLDFICYFSSVSALLGDFGSCDYAVASRFQMAYSQYREQKEQRNGKTVVINWPLWQEGNMGTSDKEQTSFYLKSSGQEPLQTSQGIDLWHDLLKSDMTQTLVILGKPSRLEQTLNRLYQVRQPINVESVPGQTKYNEDKVRKFQYQGLSVKECIISDLKQQISGLTKIKKTELSTTKNLTEYGFDSISLSKFAKRLTAYFGLEITPAIFFSATTISKLGEYFLQEHAIHIESFYSQTKVVNETDKGKITTTKLESVKPDLNRRFRPRFNSKLPVVNQEPIAIVGMSGRFPQAETVDQFWTLLAEGKDAITEIPSNRWNWHDYFTTPGDANNKMITNKGGFIHGMDEFDPLFFEISPREAEQMDPAERLLLMETYKAIEDARISPNDIRGEKVGVFVGMEESQYDQITGRQGITTSGNAMISSRLSYFLDLHGPAIATNTACSSGLVALHQAVSSLRQGECKSAIVAGISLLLSPENYMMMSKAGMLSEDGHCYSFSKNANGIGVGESVVVLMLKPLSEAIAEGDSIYGTVKASGINFDGKTNGVTAPNGDRQSELIEKVYKDYQIDTNDLSYIVTHGTGTKLGDPVEINALIKAFKKLNSNKQSQIKQEHCALTSCKSNVGHTLAASGLVSVVNLVKAMQYRQIPGSLNCKEENDYITRNENPFFINKETCEWTKEEGKPYLGAVSSFGRSGTNAHVVIEEYQELIENIDSIPRTTQNEKVMILLSARTEEQLQQRTRDLLDFIVSPSQKTVDVQELGYSLQVCREEFEERLGFIVGSVTQLAEKLQDYLDDVEDIEDTYRGKAKRNQEDIRIINDDDDMKEAIDKWIIRKKLPKLLELWVKGLTIDWKKFYGDNKPKRIALPTYPFAQDRYWVNTIPKDQSGSSLHKLHPLVHQNTSNLIQQSYSSTFRGNEFFLKDYQYQGHTALPTSIYLEMARAAVKMALPITEESLIIEMHHLEWIEPCIVNKDKNIKIVLSPPNENQISYEIFSQEVGAEICHFKGNAVFSVTSNTSKLDVQGLMRQMGEDSVEISDLYTTLNNIGISYGQSFQALKSIYQGNNQLLTRCEIPPISQGNYVLHPSIIDSILQASVVLIGSVEPLIPVALDSLTVVSACVEEMFAWVRLSQETQPDDKQIKLDIDLCDQQGNVAITMRGLELVVPSQIKSKGTTIETTQLWDGVSYQTKWEVQPVVSKNTTVTHKTVLIVCSGSTLGLEKEILHYYDQNNTKSLLVRMANKTKQVSDKEWLCGTDDPEGFQSCLKNIDEIDALYFLSMQDEFSNSLSLNKLEYSHKSNEIQFSRLVKVLKQNNKVKENIESYVLTLDTHSIHEEPNQYGGAGITGLAYSLAQGSYQFRVRNIDLSSEDLKTIDGRKKVLEIILQEPSTDRGEVFKVRSGKRYRQTLYKLNWNTPVNSAIRQNGVYLIVGGSGTVGKIITRKLIKKYGATVVWIGRSEVTSKKVQVAMELCKESGGNLKYIQADVTHQNDFEQAVASITQEYHNINGAIFAGMVFDFENSLDQTTEKEFRSIFDLKAQGSSVFYTALKKEPLDFMCYFSSGQAYSFSGAAKLSAYASGITYADSFVHSIRKQSDFPVGIINWGFWKSSIETIAERNEDISTGNFEALEDNEGFKCFEQFVSELMQGRVHQVLCMKTSQHIETLMNCNKEELISLTRIPDSSSIIVSESTIEIPQEKIKELKHIEENSKLEDWLYQLLFCQIDQLIKSNSDEKVLEVSTLYKQCGILNKYIPWWNTCLQRLKQSGYIQYEDNIITEWKKANTKEIWSKWNIEKEKYLQNPDRKAWVTLVHDCLEKLPEVLQGNVLATDIIFPNSSMDKVEGVYKNNLQSDTFNEIIANAIVAYVHQRLQLEPKAKLRILEIGAGTGGTSAIVFSKLQPFKKSIEKYCYTDLSKAFFFHAEKNYVPENPYIHCERLDIEQPVEDQDIEIGTYDLVIAANVLHATKDIRRTLQNAKAILNQNGYLLINELSTPALFNHLTFGLLDGWWLFKDSDLRMPGSPGVFPATWEQVLKEEGFPLVLFPAKETHFVGQQIIMAQSNGVIRQKISVKPKEITAKTIPNVTKSKPPQIQKQTTVSIREQSLISKPSQNIREHIRTKILDSLSETLKISPENIDLDIAFSDYGIDSILGVSFINRVNEVLSISLNTAIIFEHSSVNRLSKHINNSYQAQIESTLEIQHDISVTTEEDPGQPIYKEEAASIGSVLPPNRFAFRTNLFGKHDSGKIEENSSEIAVVGISGMFPKADNISQFWQNLIQGVDGVDELPDRYLDQRKYFSIEKQPDKTRCKWGGIVEDRDCFDPLFFNISPKEAESMNPHQRLVLQESWNAIENSGYNPKDLSGSQTGIYIGAEPTGYTGETFTGYSDAIIASRLSYTLNLNGPSFVVNTGCSSSAVALHLACESLRNKETDLALAGGVNACLDENVLIRLDKIEMLSPNGRCFTFDKEANGTIISEGIGIVVLKRLEDAIESGDKIYGLISGSGINQDGASNGITAPNGEAQEKLIVDVYKKFKIDPKEINYVEAHGTGTKLGDPVETNALVRAFQNFTDNKGFCAIGSAKSYIGHTAAAAGVIGLIKVLLSMQHNKIPKLLNFKTINPLIEFKESPFYINTEVEDWKPSNRARMAAINSFGHSGTNAHLVIKEYIQPRSNPISKTKNLVIIPLSAKTHEQLLQKAKDLLEFIQIEEEGGLQSTRNLDLVDMAYTLQVGREAMEERLSFIVNSVEELAQKLQVYIDGERAIENTWIGKANRNKDIHTLFSRDIDLQEIINKWITKNKLSNLADLWVKGLELDWNKLYTEVKPNRIHLPSYPFAKERYWCNISKSNELIRVPESSTTTIHPLLHQNTSDLSQQSYTTVFNGEEFFLKDHLVDGHKILPAVAYLEMAQVAINQASPVHGEQFILELQNTVWLKPVVVEKYKEISIALFENEEKSGAVEKIEFEIYSLNDETEEQKETIHCQGEAIFRRKEIPSKLNTDQLRKQMKQTIIEPSTVYSSFKQFGLDYGPAHQGITAIYMGEDQLLAHLSLPVENKTNQKDFTLHPGLMDSALQACIGLMVDFDDLPSRPLLPFSLETIRIISACVPEMFVWARYAKDSKPGDKLIKIDLDLCDHEGNICVQMHGFSSRTLNRETGFTSQKISIDGTYDDDFYKNIIEKVLNNEISIEAAAELN
ncbi:SDR family NAD(P)-dependent oxidoreductase [Aquimarina sp. Aq78]|uniref:SDR family NAD(P)-dependent oxidoreductase n=1 Tax=Aquimarina sp. Aq78 TaxID=1191889 RepID=UPI000D10A711|nr:SDR family NAD(P)-dependent oxidoreductase [Aquimarina sp. Aq78]